jgi:FkbM family methyltransferase
MTMSALWEKRFNEARTTGVMPMIRRRTARAKYHWMLDSWLIGTWVGLRGNRVRFDSVSITLDNPTIRSREKSNLFFGLYESSEIGLARKWIPRGIPLIEFGASIGVVSCITNRLLRKPTDHVVVEANSRIVPTLEKNRDLNKCSFSVKNAALSYGVDTVEFYVSRFFVQSSVHDRGNNTSVKITVPTVSLAKVLDQYGYKTVSLVVDVEGTEIDLIKNEGQLLRERVATFILETHPNIVGDAATQEMLATIKSLGFEMVDAVSDYSVMVFRNTSMSLSAAED